MLTICPLFGQRWRPRLVTVFTVSRLCVLYYYISVYILCVLYLRRRRRHYVLVKTFTCVAVCLAEKNIICPLAGPLKQENKRFKRCEFTLNSCAYYIICLSRSSLHSLVLFDSEKSFENKKTPRPNGRPHRHRLRPCTMDFLY